MTLLDLLLFASLGYSLGVAAYCCFYIGLIPVGNQEKFNYE